MLADNGAQITTAAKPRARSRYHREGNASTCMSGASRNLGNFEPEPREHEAAPAKMPCCMPRAWLNGSGCRASGLRPRTAPPARSAKPSPATASPPRACGPVSHGRGALTEDWFGTDAPPYRAQPEQRRNVRSCSGIFRLWSLRPAGFHRIWAKTLQSRSAE